MLEPMGTTPSGVLMGRDKELRLLHETVDDVESARRPVGLVGEPGVGKSALLAATAFHAGSRGFLVVSARGNQSEVDLPFASLHQLVRPLLPRAGRLPDLQRDALLSCFAMGRSDQVNPFFASLALLELLVDAAAERPVLVCLDDLHWMDQPSRDAFAFVTRRAADEHLAVVCTSRPETRDLDDRGIEWVELTGIDESAATALLQTLAPRIPDALRDRVLDRARGNPLALVEFATALESGVPAWTEAADDLPMTARLERAFAVRAETLDLPARALLMVAAVDDGDDIHLALAAASHLHGSPVDLDLAHQAFARGLLVLSDHGYHFSHPLVGSALRHALAPSARRQAHASLAEVLVSEPERAVWHRAEASPGRDGEIAARLEDAAAKATQRGAITSAVTWLRRAAALSPEQPAQASRLLGAAELCFQLGRYAEVDQIKTEVRGMRLHARDRSRLAVLEGVFHDGSTGEPEEVSRLVDLAEEATRTRDLDLAMQLLVGAARRAWWRDPGISIRRRILDAAFAAGPPANDPGLLAIAALAGSPEQSAGVIDHLAAWSPDADSRPDLAGLLGVAAFCSGDFPRALTFLSTPIADLREQGRMSLLAEALAIRSWAEIYLGIFDASRSADEAIRLADETGQSLWAATGRIAVALIESVRGGTVRPGLLGEAERVALQKPVVSASLLAGVQLARGVAELGAERPEEAYSELHRVFVTSDPAYQRVQQVWTVGHLAEAAVRVGRRGEAAAILAEMDELAGFSAATGATVVLEYARAVLADDDSAEASFHRAVDGAGARFPWHRARAELAYGSWLRRSRRIVEARDPLRAARTGFAAAGARVWAMRADAELRATGERGWKPASSARDLLSAQETQIAELAAQGLSNREIGQRLFLSHRTVASHLYRIFPKLGLTSRSQLASVLTDGVPASDH